MRLLAQRGTMPHMCVVLVGGVIAMLLPIAARCEDDPARLAKLLDRPTLVRKAPPKSENDPTGEITCTYYPDLMVRETGTDTPDPNNAALVPLAAGAARPACNAALHPHEIALTTEGFSLIGRKGPFLLFSATDPNGAVPFMLLGASDGRAIFTDGTADDRGIRNITVENGVLRLHYTRGFNASCSIMQDAAGCWSKLVAERKLPPDMAQPAPSSKLCAASYTADQAPADDPSMVTYDLELTLDLAGATQVLSHGAVECAPVP
jgi:hypothetical protein